MLGFGLTGARMMGGYGAYGHGGLFGIGGALFGLFVLAVVIGVIVWAVTRHKHSSHAYPAGAVPPAGYTAAAGTAEDEAMRIARERLARGEIDAEQYATIAQALRG